MSGGRHLLILGALIACLFAVLLIYSQTKAFIWDEGFHLLAAQLILHGKRPYLDFCFPQAPLNAYWNAFVMGIFGDTWRVAHRSASTITAATIVLAASYLYSRLGLAAAAAGAALIGLNILVIEYCTLGTPYAFSMFLLMAAYGVAIAAAKRSSLLPTAATGLLASAAAASTLLAAAAVPAILIWTLWCDQSRRRAAKLLAFLAGAVLPFLPVLRLALEAPRVVLFNLVQYQLFYRRANWETDATDQDLSVFLQCLKSPQAEILIGLLVIGLWRISRTPRRAEFYLAAAIGAAVAAEVATAHPTFEWYFVIAVPFLAIPAAAAVAYLPRSSWIFGGLLLLMSVTSAQILHARFVKTWPEMEAVARKVDEVTGPQQPAWLDEHVYFITRRTPVEGTEFSYAEVINLPPDLAAQFHIVHLNELDHRAAAGAYATVDTCEEAEQIEDLNLPRIFRRSVPVNSCHVFWDPER